MQLSPPRLKILFLITQLEPAGTQKGALSLARALEQRGHSVTVATMYDKGEYADLFRRRYGVEIIDLKMKPPGRASRWARVASFAGGVFRLWKLMRRGSCDVFQAFGPYSNELGPIIAWAGGIPVRVTAQRNSLKGQPARLTFLDRLVANSFLVHKIVAVSEATRRNYIEVQKIHPAKLTTIQNGIDARDFSRESIPTEDLTRLTGELALPPGARKVITIARLDPQKGHRFLIEAIPSIRNRIPNAHFLWVGEGSERENLVNQAARLGVGDCIHLLGARQDVQPLMAVSDLFVLPSLREGMSNSLLEAMALGLPVVATKVDGSSEVIQDGRTGRLVPAEDTQALAETVSSLLAAEDLRKEMAAAAREVVRNEFSAERSVSGFEQLYLELYEGRGRRLERKDGKTASGRT